MLHDHVLGWLDRGGSGRDDVSVVAVGIIRVIPRDRLVNIAAS
jgi:hypothetical protein